MKNIVVLGIGNRLLMDDGVGVYIVEKLMEQDSSSGIKYIIGETDIDYCLDSIKDSGFLIIVDAARLGNPPGHIAVFKLGEAKATPDLGLTMHNLHLFDMFAYYDIRVEGLLIGIEPHTIDYNLGLSTVLSAGLNCITEQVRDIITHVDILS